MNGREGVKKEGSEKKEDKQALGKVGRERREETTKGTQKRSPVTPCDEKFWKNTSTVSPNKQKHMIASYVLFYEVFCPDFLDHGRQMFLFKSELQWGTKVLRHFRKMAPFCKVDIPILLPCLPQPLPPKINVVFWALKSFFYFRQHWFGRWEGLRRLKGMKR